MSMQKIQILAIIITILLGLIALFYKNTKNIKIKNVVQKYKLYYIYNIIFYLSNIAAILFYKLRIDSIILVLIMIYVLYLSLDLMSIQTKESKIDEIYNNIIMFLLVNLIAITTIKYIIIVEIIRR